MEKQGVIREGVTNPEHEPEKSAADQQRAPAPTVKELDSDFRKRAAEVARINTK